MATWSLWESGSSRVQRLRLGVWRCGNRSQKVSTSVALTPKIFSRPQLGKKQHFVEVMLPKAPGRAGRSTTTASDHLRAEPGWLKLLGHKVQKQQVLLAFMEEPCQIYKCTLVLRGFQVYTEERLWVVRRPGERLIPCFVVLFLACSATAAELAIGFYLKHQA